MKSIKSKLFTSFSIILFIFLTLLAYIFIEILASVHIEDDKKKALELEKNIEIFVASNDKKKITQLEKYIEIGYEFVIIIEERKVIFSNETNNKTNEIIEKIYKEEYIKKKFFEATEFLVLYNKIDKYDVFVGIDDDIVYQYISDLVFTIISFNIIIFLILLILGYVLINRTIKPLKIVLEELQKLRSAKNLTKRVQTISTNDEFEKLVIVLNDMLDNIEKNVENIKQFSSDASHELRTPLTVIQGEIELCKNSNASKDELINTINKIDCEQKKLQNIIEDFLLLSRLENEAFKISKSCLDKVVFESIEQNLYKIEEKNLELKLDIQDNIYINFDEKYLFIVINNLLTNAIKYTQSGFIKLLVKNENNQTYFEIEDSGIGISQNNLQYIFNRFYRVDKARTNFTNGVGLGLSIVKDICNNYKASIAVKSKIDKGSTFKVVFNK